MKVELIYDFRQHPDCMAAINNLRSAENPLIEVAKTNGQVLFPWNVREKRERPNFVSYHPYADPVQSWIDEARAFLAGRTDPESEYSKIVGASTALLATIAETDPIDPLFVLSRKYPLELADYVAEHPEKQIDPLADLTIGPGFDQDWEVGGKPVEMNVIHEVGLLFRALLTKAMRQIATFTFQGYLSDCEVLVSAILDQSPLDTETELQGLIVYNTSDFTHTWSDRIYNHLIHLGHTLYAAGYKRTEAPAVWFCPDTGETW